MQPFPNKSPLSFMLHFILLVGGTAFGQTNWGSVGTVTFALTLHETAPANTIKDDEGKVVPTAQGGGANLTNSYTVRTFDRQGNETKKVETEETISKIRVSKYGNAELIAKLVLDGVLPQRGKTPFIAGWSVLHVYTTNEGSRFFARHVDKTIVDISTNAGFGFEAATAVAQNYKKATTTTTAPITLQQTVTVSLVDEKSFMGRGYGGINGTGLTLSWAGTYIETGAKVVTRTEVIDGTSHRAEVPLSGAVKMEKVSGVNGDFSAVVQGTVSATAGVLTDLSKLLPTP
jgi:hypothetical protein